MSQPAYLRNTPPIIGNSLSGTPKAKNPRYQSQMKTIYDKYLQVRSEAIKAAESLRLEISSLREEDIPPHIHPVEWEKLCTEFDTRIHPLREIYQKKIQEFNTLEHNLVVLQREKNL